jgi:hypothetical protein
MFPEQIYCQVLNGGNSWQSISKLAERVDTKLNEGVNVTPTPVSMSAMAPVPDVDPESALDSMPAAPPVSPAPPVHSVSAANHSSPKVVIKASGSQSSSSIEVEAVAVPSALPRFVYILLGVLAAGFAIGVYALLQTVLEKQLVDSKNAALVPNFELAVIKTEASINAQFDEVLNDPFNQHFDLPKMLRSVKEKEEAILLDQFRSYEAQGDLWQKVSYRTGKVVDVVEKQVAEKQQGKFFIFLFLLYGSFDLLCDNTLYLIFGFKSYRPKRRICIQSCSEYHAAACFTF